jgi:hypothetical protein
MNCLLRPLVVVLVLAGMAFSQSLGDVARENRQVKRKSAAHVYTNDDIPSVTLKDASVTAADSEDSKTDDTPKKDSAAKSSSDKTAPEAGEKKVGDPDEATRKQWQDYKRRVADQKERIDLLQRELDVLQKEDQLQAEQHYADVASRLQNSSDWAEQQQKNQDAMDAKSKALQDAKDGLESLRDEAKKAGVPASYLE